MRNLFIGATALVGLALAGALPAQAGQIGAGTVASAHLFVPTVDTSSSPATYTATMGTTFQTSATGGFAGANGKNGTMTGTLTFSGAVGTTINEIVSNFFVFDDGAGGTFNFSVASVLTQSETNGPGVGTNSFTLYALGNTVDTNLGESSTPTSLTLTFNQTNGSAYSSSATLAVPPAGIPVPEPATLSLLGAGLIALGVARRRRSV